MEYDWYADLFFLEEVYRDLDLVIFHLMAGGGAYEKAGRGLETSGRRDRRGTLQYWKRLSGTYGKMSCRRTAGIRWDMGSLETAGDRIFDDLDRFSGKTDHAPGEKECFCR